MAKYRIIFDTNKIVKSVAKDSHNVQSRLRKALEDSIGAVLRFINSDKRIKNSVIIALPKIVCHEIVSNHADGYKNRLSKAQELGNEMKEDGINKENLVIAVAEGLTIDGDLENTLNEYLSKNGIQILQVPKSADIDSLLKRDRTKVPPMKLEDKGWKDTLIWLSVIDDARNNQDTDYIFVTNNGNDFQKNAGALTDEFLRESKRSIFFKSHFTEIVSFLDEKLSLGKRKKDLISEIKKELENLEITKEINRSINNETELSPYRLVSSISGSARLGEEHASKFYNLESLEIDDIYETGENQYSIKITVSTSTLNEINKNILGGAYTISDNLYYYQSTMDAQNHEREFTIYAEYNRDKKELKIKNISKNIVGVYF